MLPNAFIVALTIRSLGLLLPHTFFQPDEFYQAFEPAYFSVFGQGFLTWEWRDLPRIAGLGPGDSLTDRLKQIICEGRLRSWVWPGVFMAVYRALELSDLQDTEWAVSAPVHCRVTDARVDSYAPSGRRADCGPHRLFHCAACHQAEGSRCRHWRRRCMRAGIV